MEKNINWKKFISISSEIQIPKIYLHSVTYFLYFDDEKKNYQYTVANLVSSMNKSNEDKLNQIFITKKVKIKQLNIYAFKPVNQNITRFIIYKTK